MRSFRAIRFFSIPRRRWLGFLLCMGAAPACASNPPPKAAATRTTLSVTPPSTPPPEGPFGLSADSLHATSACPAGVLLSARTTGGTCLEPASLGDTAATACTSTLESGGWVRDPYAARVIDVQTGKSVVCLRRPL